jgi:hypothetical protein
MKSCPSSWKAVVLTLPAGPGPASPYWVTVPILEPLKTELQNLTASSTWSSNQKNGVIPFVPFSALLGHAGWHAWTTARTVGLSAACRTSAGKSDSSNTWRISITSPTAAGQRLAQATASSLEDALIIQ